MNGIGGNNELGMRWFNFFYKFLLVGVFFSVMLCISYVGMIMNGENDDYEIFLILQVVRTILALKIYFLYKASKTSSIYYPYDLYKYTLAFIIYTSVINIITNPSSAVISGLYLILNLVYFRKRKHLFN